VKYISKIVDKQDKEVYFISNHKTPNTQKIMSKKYLTTTEASNLLSVAPDTVLKWVKAGKIESYRTPGGHYRIPHNAIQAYLPTEKKPVDVKPAPINGALYKYCWEYKSETCGKNDDCSKCIVYKSKTRRCYELRELPEHFGYLKIYCETTCEDCDYYNIVKEQGFNVLIITNDKSMRIKFNDEDNIFYKFAFSEYQSSTIIESYRPDYVVIDLKIGKKKTKEICKHISEDSRIPFGRIILVSESVLDDNFGDNEIVGWLKPLFSSNQLRNFIDNLGGLGI